MKRKTLPLSIKLLFKIGPASSPYAPGEVTRGSQARPRWPWAADIPPVRPEGTWVARGLIGGAAPQAPAVDGGDGGTHRLAAPHRAHIGVLSRRDRPAGGRDRLDGQVLGLRIQSLRIIRGSQNYFRVQISDLGLRRDAREFMHSIRIQKSEFRA